MFDRGGQLGVDAQERGGIGELCLGEQRVVVPDGRQRLLGGPTGEHARPRCRVDGAPLQAAQVAALSP